MAGTLTIGTLSDGTNSTSSTNAIMGSAKAWVSFTGSTAAIRGSFNISSVTRTTTGSYTIAFTNSMSDINYSVVGTASTDGSGNHTLVDAFANSSTAGAATAPTTSSFILGCVRYNGAAWQDPVYVNVSVFR